MKYPAWRWALAIVLIPFWGPVLLIAYALIPDDRVTRPRRA